MWDEIKLLKFWRKLFRGGPNEKNNNNKKIIIIVFKFKLKKFLGDPNEKNYKRIINHFLKL